MCPSKWNIISGGLPLVLAFSWLFCGLGVDLSTKNEREEIEKLCSKIPMLSEYATVLESHVKLRYLKKISVSSSIRNVCHQSNNLIYLAT